MSPGGGRNGSREGCGGRGGLGFGKLGFDGGGDAFGAEGAWEFAFLVLDAFGGKALGNDDECIALEGDLAGGGSAGGFGGEDLILEQVCEAAIEEVDVGVKGLEVVLAFDGGGGCHTRSGVSDDSKR